jgi:hypothetical protein
VGTTSIAQARTGRSLITDALFDRLVARIVRDKGASPEWAARIMDQALAFLVACGTSDEALAPSKSVDIGWHTFILYTRDYSEFCHQVAGRFIHHEPTDTPETKPTIAPSDMRDLTVAAIRAAGFMVDEELWTVPADCNQCTDGCTHSGGDTGCHSRVARAALATTTIA